MKWKVANKNCLAGAILDVNEVIVIICANKCLAVVAQHLIPRKFIADIRNTEHGTLQ